MLRSAIEISEIAELSVLSLCISIVADLRSFLLLLPNTLHTHEITHLQGPLAGLTCSRVSKVYFQGENNGGKYSQVSAMLYSTRKSVNLTSAPMTEVSSFLMKDDIFADMRVALSSVF